jgi:hypothetical protein
MVGYICVPDANIFSDYKTIPYEKMKMLLQDVCDEVSSKLKGQKNEHQIKQDLKKILNIDITQTAVDDERKDGIYKKIVLLCMLLNLLTASNMYACIR